MAMESIDNKSAPRWKMLPDTPTLPRPYFSGMADVNNIHIWYGLYGPELGNNRTPVVFLHGGKISSRWWAYQISHVASQGHPVVAMDTRGHGRSTDDISVPFSYDLFSDDVVSLLDLLGVATAHFVGWSDGANTCLALLMRHRPRVGRVFAFGANYRPDQGVPYTPSGVPFLSDLVRRIRQEYISTSPTPEAFDEFKNKMAIMQANYPAWTREHFSHVEPILGDAHSCAIWIVTGDSEELIRPDVASSLATMMPKSKLHVLNQVSHFAPLQDPVGFNKALDCWLER